MRLPLRIVLDTNVLVSALLKESGPPGRILKLIFAGQVIPVFDARIVHKYEAVLARPRLKIPAPLADKTLTFLAAIGEWVEPAQPELPLLHLQDPGDLPFAQIALVAGVWALVTGNERHFTRLAEQGLRVLAPVKFLSQWTERGE